MLERSATFATYKELFNGELKNIERISSEMSNICTSLILENIELKSKLENMERKLREIETK